MAEIGVPHKQFVVRTNLAITVVSTIGWDRKWAPDEPFRSRYTPQMGVKISNNDHV